MDPHAPAAQEALEFEQEDPVAQDVLEHAEIVLQPRIHNAPDAKVDDKFIFRGDGDAYREWRFQYSSPSDI